MIWIPAWLLEKPERSCDSEVSACEMAPPQGPPENRGQARFQFTRHPKVCTHWCLNVSLVSLRTCSSCRPAVDSDSVPGSLFCKPAEYVSPALCSLFLLVELAYLFWHFSPCLRLWSPLTLRTFGRKRARSEEGLLMSPEELSSLGVFLLGRE